MLNKEICKICINNKSPLSPWWTADEKRWNQKEVHCSIGSVDITKEPSIKCLYRLEHLLKETV